MTSRSRRKSAEPAVVSAGGNSARSEASDRAASLQAFGIPIEQIIESAALQFRAVDKHSLEGQTQTQAFGTRQAADCGAGKRAFAGSLVDARAAVASKGWSLHCNREKSDGFRMCSTSLGLKLVEKATKLSPKLRGQST